MNISNTPKRNAEDSLRKAVNSGNVSFVLKRNVNDKNIKDVKLQATNEKC